MTRITLILLLAAGCGSGPADRPATSPVPASGRSGLRDVPAPVMSGVEPALQERIRTGYASLLAARESPGTSDTDLGRAYGYLGKLLLAAELFDQAQPYFLNAKTLEPSELAWPYYLAHAFRLRHQSEKAIPLYEEALKIRSDHVPSLVWLGALRLDGGHVDLARPPLEKAIVLDPRSAAAQFWLGRAALAAADAPRAAQHFEAALQADPGADAVHYGLAQAYRTLGDEKRAEAHLRLWKDERLYPVDPLMEEVTGLLKTAVVYEIRGTQAMDDRKWPQAAALFREGLKIAPSDASLHQNLGTALYLSGNVRGAEAEFEEAARLQPGYAKALFSLGIVLEERGRDQDAIDRYTRALKSDPGMVNARFSLAEALRRSGKLEASVTEYAQITKSDPALAGPARFGTAMALVRLRRFSEARAVLEEAAQIHTDQPGIAHALARILAAGPDDRVRDGARSMTMVAALEKNNSPTLALIETSAMALAEVGRFTDAAVRQRQAIAAAQQSGRSDLVAPMVENLRLYESGRPCRTPWPDDDPVHFPRASAGARN